jgi:hypothetical protein
MVSAVRFHGGVEPSVWAWLHVFKMVAGLDEAPLGGTVGYQYSEAVALRCPGESGLRVS